MFITRWFEEICCALERIPEKDRWAYDLMIVVGFIGILLLAFGLK